MRARLCVLALSTVLLWQLPAVAGDAATAREQLKIGYLLAQEGKCEQAVLHLRESLRLDPKAITLINLADCEEKLGKLADAMAHWVDARARAVSEAQRPIEEEATARLNALEPRLARLTITLAKTSPANATVERDGVVLGSPSLGIALPVDPGRHVIVVKAEGHADATTELTLREGEAKRVELTIGAVAEAPKALVRPAEKSESSQALPWIGFGVAGAGAAVGAITGLMALNAGNEAESACPNRTCTRPALDDVESGRTMATVSTVAFIVAGASAALGIYGLVRAQGAPEKKAAVTVSPFGLQGRF